MSEENGKLGCGHRNDMPHLLTLIAAKLLWGGVQGPLFTQIPANFRSALVDELQDSIASAFKHAGIPNNEVDGARIFAAVKEERIKINSESLEADEPTTFNPNVPYDV